jgi:hypothetical protein
LLRLIVALWNGFIGPTPGADLDALGLNGFASAVSTSGSFDDFAIGYVPYTNILGFIYSYTLSHIVVGCILSCLTWWISGLILYKSMHLLSVDRRNINFALLIYTLLPSSIMLTAVTLREPYQLLFVNIILYAIIKIYCKKNYAHWLTLTFGIACAGVLHGALLAFGFLVFVGLIFLIVMRGRKRIPWVNIIMGSVISAVFLFYGFSLFTNIAYNLNDGLGSAIGIYQDGLLTIDARTHYKSDVEISGVTGLLVFVPVSLFQYLFEPVPWRISNFSDLLLFCENVLRAWLIYRAWKSSSVTQQASKKITIFVFMSYFAQELIWSIGTVNWGTSVRHHMPSFGLLLFAAYALSNKRLCTQKEKIILETKMQ